jgi:hypothetical protein
MKIMSLDGMSNYTGTLMGTILLTIKIIRCTSLPDLDASWPALLGYSLKTRQNFHF